MSSNTTYANASQKCFNNIELVANICKFLTYQQQFQLLNTCRELKIIIVNFVWKTKFQEVEIQRFSKTTGFLVSEQIYPVFSDLLSDADFDEIFRQKSVFLKGNELNSFLKLNEHNITKLQLMEVKLPLGQTLANLKYLSYQRLVLSNEDLRKVTDNCLKLETLIVFNCFNLEGQPLVLDRDIDLEIIQNMPQLKNLVIGDYNMRSHRLYNMSNVDNILSQLQLQCLNLNLEIAPNDDDQTNGNVLKFSHLKCCKMFRIGGFTNYSDYLRFQTDILPNFESLCELYLKGGGNKCIITKDLFNILLRFCGNLKKLSLDDCRIMEFIALPDLNELSIQQCSGLTCLCLRTILNEMNLKSFSSEDTTYKGVLECFLISSTLQKLKCDFTTSILLTLFEFNHKNLQNLTEFSWYTYSYQNFPLLLSNCAPNLKVLGIQQLHLNVEDCFKLKFLQKLYLTTYSEIVVSQLLQLFKHEHLSDLTIDYVRDCRVDVDLTQLVAFRTNLMSLKVPCIVVEAMTDFCFDLLQLNGKLSLTCLNITAHLIADLLSNAKFPKRCSCINICGFYIDCISIQERCVETTKLIKLLTSVFNCHWKRYFILE